MSKEDDGMIGGYKVTAEHGHIEVGPNNSRHDFYEMVVVDADDAEKLAIAIEDAIPMARQQNKEMLEAKLKETEARAKELREKLSK
jgi:hypothetical protein